MAKLVELNLRPDVRTLRQFGFIALGGFGLMALFAFEEMAIFRAGLGAARVPVAAGLAGLALLCTTFSLVYPRANLPIYVGISVVFFPVGAVASYVLLGVLFFLVIGPISLIIRVLAADPMKRGYDPTAKSYWVEPERRRTKQSYFHQF